MPTDRTTIATAAIGSVLVGVIAVARPDLAEPLTLAVAAFVALLMFLKM
ncbi:hypothetical protein ACFVZD_36825 [Streptomyces sp. NPDC058287]